MIYPELREKLDRTAEAASARRDVTNPDTSTADDNTAVSKNGPDVDVVIHCEDGSLHAHKVCKYTILIVVL